MLPVPPPPSPSPSAALSQLVVELDKKEALVQQLRGMNDEAAAGAHADASGAAAPPFVNAYANVMLQLKDVSRWDFQCVSSSLCMLPVSPAVLVVCVQSRWYKHASAAVDCLACAVRCGQAADAHKTAALA